MRPAVAYGGIGLTAAAFMLLLQACCADCFCRPGVVERTVTQSSGDPSLVGAVLRFQGTSLTIAYTRDRRDWNATFVFSEPFDTAASEAP